MQNRYIDRSLLTTHTLHAVGISEAKHELKFIFVVPYVP